MANTLLLPRWSKANNCCALCLCTKRGECTWKNFQSENAPWTSKIWTPAAWSAWPERRKCRLFEIKGLTAANVACDWMHAKYLGTDLVAFGSVLYLWVFQIGLGSQMDNLRAFDDFLKGFYRENRTASRFAAILSTRMFLNKKGVKLKGKAAQVKCLGLPLLMFWQQVCNQEIEIHRQITFTKGISSWDTWQNFKMMWHTFLVWQ